MFYALIKHGFSTNQSAQRDPTILSINFQWKGSFYWISYRKTIFFVQLESAFNES